MPVENLLLFLTKPTQSQKLFLLTLIITIYFDLPYVYFGKFKLKHMSKKCYELVSNPRKFSYLTHPRTTTLVNYYF